MDDELVKVTELQNEVEARVLDDILIDQGIPHAIRSYHDSALDGLFQNSWGWGHVEAPPSRADTVIEILNDLRSGAPAANEESETPQQ